MIMNLSGGNGGMPITTQILMESSTDEGGFTIKYYEIGNEAEKSISSLDKGIIDVPNGVNYLSGISFTPNQSSSREVRFCFPFYESTGWKMLMIGYD